jgi:hypothetical protein
VKATADDQLKAYKSLAVDPRDDRLRARDDPRDALKPYPATTRGYSPPFSSSRLADDKLRPLPPPEARRESRFDTLATDRRLEPLTSSRLDPYTDRTATDATSRRADADRDRRKEVDLAPLPRKTKDVPPAWPEDPKRDSSAFRAAAPLPAYASAAPTKSERGSLLPPAKTEFRGVVDLDTSALKREKVSEPPKERTSSRKDTKPALDDASTRWFDEKYGAPAKTKTKEKEVAKKDKKESGRSHKALKAIAPAKPVKSKHGSVKAPIEVVEVDSDGDTASEASDRASSHSEEEEEASSYSDTASGSESASSTASSEPPPPKKAQKSGRRR